MNIPEDQSWNELRALQLLRESTTLIEGFRAYGVEIPNAEVFYARIVKARDEEDMGTYGHALEGLVEAY